MEPCAGPSRSEIAWCGIIHPDRERYISLPEAKRLTGFPDDFKLPGRKLGIGLVGNSVPPPLMRAIALHVRERILSVPTRAA
jgi:DNA (cytosine-5)-methyltransferase 1